MSNPKSFFMKNENQKNELQKQENQVDEMTSFNEQLYDEYTICELEERLETKPWICGANVDCPQLSCGLNNPPPTEEVPDEN